MTIERAMCFELDQSSFQSGGADMIPVSEEVQLHPLDRQRHLQAVQDHQCRHYLAQHLLVLS
jgi:hypothetical protein